MIEALTGVLVLVTGFYAWQNQRMVKEMRDARKTSVRPHLSLDLERLGGASAALTVTNVGLGPAIDVHVEISFVPRDEHPSESRTWRPPVLAPSQGQRFFIPVEGLDMNAFAASYEEVRLKGSMSDVLGSRHQVADAITEIEARWEQTKEAKRMFSDPPFEAAAKELTKQVKELRNPLQRIAAAIRDGRG